MLACGTRWQVLACLIFTSMCVTALLLGRRSGSPLDRALAGIVAAGCMLPCRMLLPRLYRSANAPPDPKDVPWRPVSTVGGPRDLQSSRRGSSRARPRRGAGRGSRQAVVPLGRSIVLRDESASRASTRSGQDGAVDMTSPAAAALADRRMRIQTVIKVGRGMMCGSVQR
jgi:hypothetical protein